MAWKRVGGIMQRCDRLTNEGDVLLELIHRTLLQWKRFENNSANERDVHLLKCIYISLLREARKRKLALNPKQLLDRILYPGT